MSDKKNSYPRSKSAEMADMFSKQKRRNKDQMEQQHYPIEDKRKVVREEHTNGSTPSSRL